MTHGFKQIKKFSHNRYYLSLLMPSEYCAEYSVLGYMAIFLSTVNLKATMQILLSASVMWGMK